MNKITLRIFTLFFALAMVAGVAAPAAEAATEKRIYTVSTAHLDTIWEWDFETTVEDYISKTLYQNFSLFEKFEDYVFNFEGAYRYDLMKEYYPDEYELLKAYVDNGNWAVSGSAWENGDVNVPSAEALIRNFLYGNDFFEEEFGKRTSDIYLPDCFGFGYALPSIAAHCNLVGFGTQKLSWGYPGGAPFKLGVWRGVDGSEIYAALDLGVYVSQFDGSPRSGNLGTIESLNENISKYGLPFTVRLHGNGDTGGGPGQVSVAAVANDVAKNDEEDIKVLSATTDQIYLDMEAELTDEQKSNLPLFDGELPLLQHGVGGYTSRTVGKRWNRMNEMLGDAAERSATAAMFLGADYPQEELTEAWLRVIAHQFHDDIPGTSVMRAYLRSWNEYAVSLSQFAQEYENAVGNVTRLLDTTVTGNAVPVVVNNPVSHDRIGSVEADVTLDGDSYAYVKVTDPDGNEVPSQVVGAPEGNVYTVVFEAEVPSMGYAVYSVEGADAGYAGSTGLSVSADGHTLESDRYTVSINTEGNIQQVYDKTLGKNLLSSAIEVQALDYNHGDWPSWELAWSDVNSDGRTYLGEGQAATIEIIEDGPARVAVQVTQTGGATANPERNESTLVSTITLDASGDMVEVQNVLDWNTRQTLLKTAFPLTAADDEATFDLDLGVIKRPTSSGNAFEYAAQKWADISDRGGDFGVSIFSDSRYGWDKRGDNTLRLTSVYTPKNNYNSEHGQDWQDIGENRYGYAIFGHENGYEAGTQYGADFFNQPLRAFQTTAGAGSLGKVWSFAGLSTDQVQVKAVKKIEPLHAQADDEIVVRFGGSTDQVIQNIEFEIGEGIVDFRELYGSEEPMEGLSADATLTDGKLVFTMNGFTPRTFALTLADASATISAPAYDTLALNYNADVYSSNDNLRDSDAVFQGKAYPTELLPEDGIVTTGGVPFQLGPTEDGKANAVIASGQSVDLPSGANRVYLLAAATGGEDVDDVILVGSDGVALTFGSYTENFAVWDMPLMNVTGYVKDLDVGYMSTHTHSMTGDVTADSAYMYKYTLEVPAGVTSITLPDNDEVVIFAVTAVSDPRVTTAATALYDQREKAEDDGPGWTGFVTGFESDEPAIDNGVNGSDNVHSENNINSRNLRQVSAQEEGITPPPDGSDTVLKAEYTANSTGTGTFSYRRIFNGVDVEVTRGTLLAFDFMPTTEESRYMSVDAELSSSPCLRDRGITALDGTRLHPGGAKGTVGEWTHYEFDLSSLAGLSIENLMIGMDLTPQEETHFVGYFDNIEIKSYDDYEKSDVERLVEQAKAIDSEGYVPATYAALTEAVEYVEGKLDARTYTGQGYRQLANYLESVVAGLVRVREDVFDRIEIEDFDEKKGNFKIEDNPDASGGINVGEVNPEAYLAYKHLDFGEVGAEGMVISYASRHFNEVTYRGIDVRLGSRIGELIGYVDLEVTAADNWDNYVEAEINFNRVVTGEQDVYLVFRGDRDRHGNQDPLAQIANLDYLQFIETGMATPLRLFIEKIDKMDSENYTVSSWENLEKILERARELLEDDEASQNDFDAMLAELQAAVEALVDLTELKGLISDAEDLEAEDYTPATWKALEGALADAKTVLADDDVLQATVDEAAKALQAALNNLEKRANTDALRKLIESIQELDEAEYTAGSWETLKNALNAATVVLENKDASQEQVDAAADALKEAIDGLVNIAALRNAVTEANTLDEEDYTPDSFAALTKALEDAVAVLADANATQAQVNAAYKALEDAIDGLLERMDKSALAELVKTAEALDPDDYTADSYAAVTSAIEAAEAVLANDSATQEQIDEAYWTLDSAIQALVERVDKSKLTALVETAEALDEKEYTPESFTTMTDALADAKTVLADDIATQEQVDAAYKALEDAINALVKQVQVDKSKLDKLVETAEALDEKEYTSESFAAVTKALETAQAVLTNDSATQEQVDAAADALEEAIDALVKQMDKDALTALVKFAEALDEKEYTPESFAAVTKALESAKTVLADDSATQDQVNAAADALEEAIKALVKQVDKGALTALVETAEALDEKEYTPESFASVTKALADAKTVLTDDSATQEQVDAAADALEEAIDALVKQVDKSKLTALVSDAKALRAADYTPKSYAAVTSALTSAEAVLANDSATQAQVDTAYNTLSSAVSALVKRADTSSLTALVSEAKALSREDYTNDSYAAVAAAITDAEAVLADANATQAQVNAAYTALSSAVNGLKSKAEAGAEELAELVDEVKGYDAADYTEESYGALLEAIEQADAVLADKNATYEDILAAQTALEKAVSGLVPVGEEDTCTVSATAGPGGTITGTVSVAKGGNAELEVLADENCALVAILIDGITVDISTVEDGVFTIEAVESDLTVRALFMEEKDHTEQYKDVSAKLENGEDTWYYNSVNLMTGLGIMEGYAGEFEPESQMTREQFAKMVYMLAETLGMDVEEAGETQFKDVEADRWSVGVIGWAYENGIVLGHDDNGETFAPAEPIRREDMAVMMQRFFEEFAEIELPGDTEITFKDANEIDSWAEKAVPYVVRTGLMKGQGDDRFTPRASTRRNEVAEVFMNYFIFK